jgi:hypothetical protein
MDLIMARSVDVTCTVTLPNYGEVIANLSYYVGFSGSYWEPPDTDEVVINTITKDGEVVNLTDDEEESFYGLFLEAGGIEYERGVNQFYNSMQNSLDEADALIEGYSLF